MDRFFGGILRSDVVCASCGYTSTAHDPFKDISVDILESPTLKPRLPVVGVPKPNPVSASKAAAKGTKSASKGTHCYLITEPGKEVASAQFDTRRGLIDGAQLLRGMHVVCSG